MTEVGFIIQPGEAIPEDVTRMLDCTGDTLVLNDLGHWHTAAASDPATCFTEGTCSLYPANFAPLTVTAVREQPAEPAPLVLSLPTVPDGAVALVGKRSSGVEIRFSRRMVTGNAVWFDDDGSHVPASLATVLEKFGPVTVVMREPRTWPKLDAPDASAVRGASGRIWRRVSPTVWACNDDEGGEECENFAALQQYDGPLVEVFDDKDSTR